MTSFFANILLKIYNIIGNYGVSIIIFTLIVRIAMLPLAINQRKNMLKSQKMQPLIKELQKKYAHDREKLAQEQMKLFKENNFNPMGGCLPLLIQFPIIIALFNVFRDARTYMPASALTEKFLWLPNMEMPDMLSNIIPNLEIAHKLPGALPIIAALFTYLTFKSTMGSTQTEGGPNMGFMALLTPLMILWFGSNYAAGLILYWAASNIIQYVQNLILIKVYDGE